MKRGFKIILFLFILFTTTFLLDSFYTHHFKQTPVKNKPNWIFSIKNQAFDYAFIGSSDVQRDINILTIDKKIGLKGLNLGIDGTSIAENLMLIQEFVKNGNKLNHLFVQVYTRQFDPKQNFPINYHNYIPYLSNQNIDKLFKEHATPLKYLMWKHIPFAAYSEFNYIYNLKALIQKSKLPYFSYLDSTKGSELLFENKQHLTPNIDEFFSIQPDPYLFQLLNYLQENKITSTLVTLPRYYTQLVHLKNKKKLEQTIDSICKTYGASYLNFTQPEFKIGYQPEMFYDNSHLNGKGAYAFSEILADSIKKHISQNRN